VKSRGADFKTFREFMHIRFAHDETLWKESIPSPCGLVCV